MEFFLLLWHWHSGQIDLRHVVYPSLCEDDDDSGGPCSESPKDSRILKIAVPEDSESVGSSETSMSSTSSS